MSESVSDSSNSVDKISLPLSQMICAECDATPITEPYSAVEYSRTKKEITFGKKRHFEVVVDVIHVARKYDSITATYSVNAVFRIHCPSCKQDRLETKQLAELPLKLLKDLGTCPTCDAHSSIHIISSRMIQLSENVDEIRLKANMKCAECNSESSIYKQIKTYLHKYLQSSLSARVSSYDAPPIRLENSDFEVNTLKMNTMPDQTKRISILFLAANPTNSHRLRLDAEIRSIDYSLRLSEYRDKFELQQHWAVRAIDIQELLLRHKPDIVHFSGHGNSSSELIFEDALGKGKSVSSQALSQLFSIFQDNIRCVLLNACYSQEQAKAIAEHIDCVVGMSNAIGDAAAISFATSFYRGLGYGTNIAKAFKLACNEISLQNIHEHDTPQLISLKSDPSEIKFIAA